MLQSSLLQFVTYGYNVAPYRMDGSDHIANCRSGVKWQTGNTVHSPSAFAIHFTNVHSDRGTEFAVGGTTLRRYSEVSLAAATLC
jgi:hypothetical protein